MRLTTKGRYAVQAMIDIAQYGKSKPVTLSDIAIRQNITLNYLEQLFSQLKKSGLVISVRGPGGGYKLAQTARTITVADIMQAAGERLCVAELETTSSCPITQDLWEGLNNSITNYLGSVSLADLEAKSTLALPKEVCYANE